MKLFLASLLLSFILLINPSTQFANENFDVGVNATYQILNDTTTKVTKSISIENKKEFTFSPNYNISFGFEDIKNIEVFNTNGSIPFDFEKHDGIVSLHINFVNPPKGVGEINSFTISFETNEVVDKKGEIYEVSIPGISNPESFFKYDTRIIYPSDYPEISIMKPNLPEKINDLSFSKEETKGAGIVLIFGKNQYFDLSLNYNISNPNLFPIITEIALPPNTNYQKVLLENLSIEPKSTRRDNDGNFIATYLLSPRERMTVVAKVKIKLLSSPENEVLTDEQRNTYLSSNKYWEVGDSRIKAIIENLKTPEDIYKYVVDKLSYNFDRVSSGDQRYGALGAIDNSSDAVCLEYADLFVTLARSKGIPARTIEGFAHTRNTKLRPTSLDGDVLHAWAQYYDYEKKAWIMVDPTWGNTTNGIDYFNNLDLDHITFVIKGEESTYPIPAGGYKFEDNSQDIKATFSSQKDFKPYEKIEIKSSLPTFSFSGLPVSGLVTIKNTGNTQIQSKLVRVTNDTTGETKQYEVSNLSPYGEESFSVSFDTSFLTNNTYHITIEADDEVKTTETKISFIPDLNLILIGGGMFVSTGLLTWFTVKTGRIYIQRRKK